MTVAEAENQVNEEQAPAPQASVAETQAAAKKAEANRKKKERQKAKARAEKERTAAEGTEEAKIPALLPSAEAVAAGAAVAPRTMRSERLFAGEDRGYGMFATEDLNAGEEVASTLPALSVVFDESASEVCAFCFACAEPSTNEVDVVLQRKPSGWGLLLDDRPSTDSVARIAGVVKDGPNVGSVFIGDRLLSIDGVMVEGGHLGAIKLLKEAEQRLGECATAQCRLARPSRVECRGCGKLSACAACVKAGRLDWHRHECQAFQALPPQAKVGETSTLRLLLRFRMTQQPEIGDWAGADAKETTTALTSLQRNPVNLERSQLANVAAVAGISANDAGALISMVRTNACSVQRNGKKAGCALSALVGWHNHDCAPNASAVVRDDGRIALHTLGELPRGAELLISYVDVTEPREARRRVLTEHYGFECRCDRCKLEQRASLKNALKESQQRRR